MTAIVALHVAHAMSEQTPGYNLTIVFVKPIDESAWDMKVRLEGVNTIECSGVLRPNAYYVQTRDISDSIVVAPLYYVLDRVCYAAISEIQLLAAVGGNSSIRVTVKAPEGYIVRSSLDWRGYGPLGGPYTLDAASFAEYYVFDGIVVANASVYRVEDLDSVNITVVSARGIRSDVVEYAVESVVAVRTALSRWLGPSPRAPVVIVLVGAKEHYLQPPGSAHSMGGVVYMKIGSSQLDDISWLVHTMAHEAVHGWFNHGMLYGDFSFQEAAAEFLAIKALHDMSPKLYEIASSYLRAMLEAGEQYAIWMRANAALWYAGVEACREDLYMNVVSMLYNESLTSRRRRPVSLLDIAMMMSSGAPLQCRERLETAMGKVFEAASRGSSNWPFIDTSVFHLEDITGKLVEKRIGHGLQNAADAQGNDGQVGCSQIVGEPQDTVYVAASSARGVAMNYDFAGSTNITSANATCTPCSSDFGGLGMVYASTLSLSACVLAYLAFRGLCSRRGGGE
ncbi:hypothetical protein [Pyrodictium abyssi]